MKPENIKRIERLKEEIKEYERQMKATTLCFILISSFFIVLFIILEFLSK